MTAEKKHANGSGGWVNSKIVEAFGNLSTTTLMAIVLGIVLWTNYNDNIEDRKERREFNSMIKDSIDKQRATLKDGMRDATEALRAIAREATRK